MRKLFTLIGLLTMVLLLSVSFSALAQKTVVYVVRHAEKDLSDPANRNPKLSEAGAQRAQELDKVLKSEKMSAIFSTDYNRTLETVAPVAERRDMFVIVYAPTNFKGLADRIKGEFAGKTVLVAGHSNTVLEIVEALGGKRPVPELTEEDYDYLFKVVMNDEGKTITTTMNFGKRTKKG
ncbi:MAG TPA: histidine phosphatase family protein [Sphingobacteriaceae bacterium]